MMGAFCNIEGAYALRAVNKETAEAEAQNLPTAEEAERIDALIACCIAVLEEQLTATGPNDVNQPAQPDLQRRAQKAKSRTPPGTDPAPQPIAVLKQAEKQPDPPLQNRHGSQPHAQPSTSQSQRPAGTIAVADVFTAAPNAGAYPRKQMGNAAKDREEQDAQPPIVPGDKRQLQRRADESDQSGCSTVSLHHPETAFPTRTKNGLRTTTTAPSS